MILTLYRVFICIFNYYIESLHALDFDRGSSVHPDVVYLNLQLLIILLVLKIINVMTFQPFSRVFLEGSKMI